MGGSEPTTPVHSVGGRDLEELAGREGEVRCRGGSRSASLSIGVDPFRD
jgi:hypothetical protein